MRPAIDFDSGLIDRRLPTARSHVGSERFAPSTRDRPAKWTPAHASKAASANQLLTWLSAKRTAAFWSALLDARSAGVQRWVLRAGRDNFRDNLAVRSVPVTQSVSYT